MEALHLQEISSAVYRVPDAIRLAPVNYSIWAAFPISTLSRKAQRMHLDSSIDVLMEAR